jgi:acylphosphatase
MVDPISSEPLRIHIWVTGRVQGVGFRSFVQQVGRQLDLTGWVRNDGYDSVEMLAEGPLDKLKQFAGSVKIGPVASRVEAIREEWETASGEYMEFFVRSAV